MRFGPVPLDQALGTVLAHSHPLPGGGRLRKGRRLTPGDIEALRSAGATTVTVARLEDGDIDEDSAALALARALVPDPEGAGLEMQPVGTGRVNLIAAQAGLASVAADRVHAVNAVDPGITLATVPPWQRMDPGGMVATVKIIAYAVPGAAMRAACVAGRSALSLRRPVLRRAALIETVIGAGPESAASLSESPRGDTGTENTGTDGTGTENTGGKGWRVTAERLSRLGVELDPVRHVPHAEAPLAQALTATADAGVEMVLILTGSATSDSHDVAPQALRLAGGRVAHYGMPVDPGNLLFLGDLKGLPVVGLPGCARSPALNGADWVIERLICAVPVDGAAIMRMGVGGLLKEIPQRPRPRRQQG